MMPVLSRSADQWRSKHASEAVVVGGTREIRVGLWARESLRAIARRLGRAPSTLSREVTRNHGRWRYRAAEAHQRAVTDRLDRGIPSWWLTAGWRTVEWDLRAGYSPAGIAVRLRQAGGPTVCPETIYRSLYSSSYVGLSLRAHECLRSRRRRRRHRHEPRPARGRRRFGALQAHRPATRRAADRSEPGHWEGDLIIGASHASAVITLVERTSRLTLLARPASPADRQ